MGKPAGGGSSRLAVAKAALRTLVDGLPDGSRVGLRLYGHRVAGAGRAAGCRDTELVTRVGPLDRSALKAQIASYRAVGSTPIGRALRAAAADLPAQTPGSIVLVSDGGDNCAPPNPCLVAGELAAAGTAVSIQAIGFQVGERARRQLRCIAGRGRGVYRDAADADELAVALRALAARALRRYTPVGKPIRGGATAAAAAPISGGRYADRIGADEDRWYAVPLRVGQRLAAVAVVSHACPFPRGLAEMFGTSLELTLFDPSGELPEASSGVANLFVGDESSESDGLLTSPIGDRSDPDVEPSRPGRYLLRVRLSDNGNGVLGDVLDGSSLALGVQTNIIGGRRSASSAVERPPAAAGSPGQTAGVLAAVVVGCLVLGALARLCAARLRRRAS
ncbi:MAG: Ca-activated chloride channel [Solirubrobacteraceae bacterium]|nr:Ca-activated chloride channel [Solirubrobacteraceae bacterium]